MGRFGSSDVGTNRFTFRVTDLEGESADAEIVIEVVWQQTTSLEGKPELIFSEPSAGKPCRVGHVPLRRHVALCSNVWENVSAPSLLYR